MTIERESINSPEDNSKNSDGADGESFLNVSVTFRHTQSTDALKHYAIEKILHSLSKYVHDPADVHVILSVEKRDHTAEVNLHSRQYDLSGKASTEDLYSAIDKVVDTVLAQLRKQKGRQLAQKHQVATV